MKLKIAFVFILLFNFGHTPPIPTHAENTDINIAQLSVGVNHGLLLTDDNTLFAFGNRYNGNFGDNNLTNGLSSRLIDISTQGDLASEDFTADPIKKIEANNTMSALLTTNGDLYLWGNNETGSIGNGTTDSQYTPLKVDDFGELSNLTGGDYLIDVSLNANNGGNNNGVLALSQAGRLFYWGAARLGMSGEGSVDPVNSPKEITNAGELANLIAPDKLVSISAGNLTLGVVSDTGRVFTWGFNSLARAVGSPTIGSTFTQNSPIEITNSGFLNDLSGLGDKVVSIKMNQFSGMVKTQAGRYVIWGLNTEGQAGQSSRGQYILPVEVTNQGAFAALDLPNNETIEQIELGGSSFVALTSLGKIYSWGWNDQGALGTDSPLTYGLLDTPINSYGVLANLHVNEKVTRIFKQNLTTLAITNQNRLIGWGPNSTRLYFGSTLASSNIPIDLTTALNNALKEPFEIVIDQIDALPPLANLTVSDEEAIEAARAAYDAIAEGEKALVTNYQSLLDAEARLEILLQEAANQAAADAVIAVINALPDLEDLNLLDEEQVNNALIAYDILSPEAKALVTNLQTLQAAEGQLYNLRAAQTVIDLITALPNPVTLVDETQVVSVTAAWEALTDDQKNLVSNWGTLEIAIETIYYLNSAIAMVVMELIDALPEEDAITKDDADTIAAARAAYTGLTPSQKALVTNLDRLVNAENTLAGLSDNQGSLVTVFIIILAIAFLTLGIIYWFFTVKKKK
jgi:hypothetical protein